MKYPGQARQVVLSRPEFLLCSWSIPLFIIAHRGASAQFPENSLGAIHYSAAVGADAVEVDLRRTKDGQFVIFHDADLKRIDNTTLSLKELSLEELNQRLDKAKHPPVLTLSQLKHEYNKKLPIVFDLKLERLPDSLLEMLDSVPFYYYLGVRTVSALAAATSKWNRTRILALVPEPAAIEKFVTLGAGIIRLWEDWLTQKLVSTVHGLDAVVWVMTGRSGSVGATDEKALARILNLSVDGIILNDPRLLLRCLKKDGSSDG